MGVVQFIGKGLVQKKGTNEEAVWLRKKKEMGSGIQVMVASGKHVDSYLFIVIGGKADEMGVGINDRSLWKNAKRLKKLPTMSNRNGCRN